MDEWIVYGLVGTGTRTLFQASNPWTNPDPGWIVMDSNKPETPLGKYGDFIVQNTIPGTWLWVWFPAPVTILNGMLRSDEDQSLIPASALPENVASRLSEAESILAGQASAMGQAVTDANSAKTQAQNYASDASAAAESAATTAVQAAISSLGAILKAEECTVTLGSGGAATFNFANAYASAPILIPISRFSGSPPQQFLPVFSSQTATSVSVAGKKSVGTILLNGSPFMDCVSGDVVRFLAIGP